MKLSAQSKSTYIDEKYKGSKNWFKNLKLKHKLAWVYGLAGFLPILILLLVTYFQMKTILRDKEMETVNSYLYQATASMDNEIEIYNNLANYISFNQSISQVLSYGYSSPYEMYEQFVNEMDPLLSSLLYFHSEIDRVTIYVDNGTVKHGSTLAPISEISDEEWYDDVINNSGSHWYVDKVNKKVFSVSKMAMLDRYKMTGVLYISIDYDSVFEPFEQSIINNYGLFILDSDDNTVFSQSVFDQNNSKYSMNYNQFLKVKDGKGQYEILSKSSDTSNWNVYLYKPRSLMVSSVTPIIRIAIIAAIVCAIAAILTIRTVSRFVTNRVTYLQKSMKEVEKGNFLINISTDSSDEIGDLIAGFDKMLGKLNKLINEVYESKIKEKEYEMRALQAQINPHFLYNTLSLINWKAIEAGADDISKITLSLSTFYRTSLNKGKNVMNISDEIDNMQSYLNIQLMMHDDDFDVSVDIDNSIMQFKTLNLILQPLIENAIDHGIDIMTEGRGKIAITGRNLGDEIELVVADNGVGMTDEQAMKILTEESKGYGVRNVNERIKLYYGEQYALHIESIIGEGTRVIVRFPKVY